ncbi:hypothetical protein Bbelb_427710 [Branchiostoma belcheri]|nr:hypothetical protein Bbelb_427710 [Branchiostoma belcheri]
MRKAVARLFGKAILKRLLPSITPVIINQYAYLKGSSTVIAAVRMVHTWLTSLDSRDQRTIQVLFADGRRQGVLVNGKVSSWQLLTSGVPQGGVLSPYLVLLYMSSRSTVYNDTLDVGYADDVGMSRSIPCRSCGVDNTMSAEALQLDTWAGQNDMLLNGKKSHQLQICFSRNTPVPPPLSLGGELVPVTTTAKGLGFTFDSTLSWRAHVKSAVSKAVFTVPKARTERLKMSFVHCAIKLYNESVS